MAKKEQGSSSKVTKEVRAKESNSKLLRDGTLKEARTTGKKHIAVRDNHPIPSSKKK
jgi:hypothetical protein